MLKTTFINKGPFWEWKSLQVCKICSLRNSIEADIVFVWPTPPLSIFVYFFNVDGFLFQCFLFKWWYVIYCFCLAISRKMWIWLLGRLLFKPNVRCLDLYSGRIGWTDWFLIKIAINFGDEPTSKHLVWFW